MLRWKLQVLKLAVYCPVQEVINSIQVQVQQNGDGGPTKWTKFNRFHTSSSQQRRQKRACPQGTKATASRGAMRQTSQVGGDGSDVIAALRQSL